MKDVLKDSLQSANLGITLGTIVATLGIPDNEGIIEEFTWRDAVTYTKLDGPHDRALFIESWLRAELRRAADRCAS